MIDILEIALGRHVPDGWMLVIRGRVKKNHQIWDKTMMDYRPPFESEIGREVKKFLSVIVTK